MRADQHWRVSKQINVATIISLGAFVVVQTATLSYGWATMSARIDMLEKAAIPVVSQGERLIRLETKFDGMGDTLKEIRAAIEKVPTRAAP